jgi:peptidoglycan/xylan/chitin deacetylase (PgdA/CDA1 family)
MITTNSIRVLLYHKVSLTKNDRLTVSAAQFEKQLQIIKKKNYNTILLSDLVNYLNHKADLPPRPLLLTFDDGYKNNYTVAYPLLKKFRMKANIFLVSGFLQNVLENNYSEDDCEYLHINDLKKMDPAIIEFGLHTEHHGSYDQLSIEEIDQDIKNCKSALRSLSVTFQPCFAYTFGHCSKRDEEKANKIFQVLEANDIELAFRIGNRINKLPLVNKFLIQRIEIWGSEALWKFPVSLKRGRKIFLK